ncbi:nitroreductase family deazaflavin-dependent oxidoreductase [Nocardia beijingensis]|uniref:nitroreductase family deazaflavin-dependent oxidoreductase n=1 Tax=Nocardia beijingensis TaxID=95162 RepID=UPI0033BC8619
MLPKELIVVNRLVFNPIYRTFTWLVAPYGTIVVRDRHSGDVYPVPTGVYPGDNGSLMLPMSYGTDINWLKNLWAAGGAQIWYKGVGRAYHNPRYIPAEDAYAKMPAPLTQPYKAFGTEQFLVLDPDPAGPVTKRTPMGAMAQVNKRVANPVVSRVAGRGGPLALVEHTGRKSGKTFRTPVAMLAGKGRGKVMLPYGKDVDWVRNVLAASKAAVTYRGKRYTLTNPRMVDGVVASLEFDLA